MIKKDVSDINEADILQLCQEKAEESPTLEFKRELPAREDRKEFVAYVCAFANTLGGDIVYGINQDEAGCASAVSPLHINADETILRLTSTLVDCIEPRLHGVTMQAVLLTEGGHVLVIRIPRSFSGVHRSKLDGQFWIRESRSKRSLDVPGLINRVSEYLGREDKLNEFFARRYAAIATNSYPLKLKEGPKVVMHVLPARDFLAGEEIDITALSQAGSFVLMPRNGSSYATHTFEGVLHHHEVHREDRTVRAATLVFRSGVVEAIASILPLGPDYGTRTISFEAIETYIAGFAELAIPKLLSSKVENFPLVLRVALTNMAGVSVNTLNQELRFHLDEVPQVHIHAPVLVYPEVLIEEMPIHWGARLEATFDRIWQTWGYQKAYTFQRRGDGLYWNQHKVPELS